MPTANLIATESPDVVSFSVGVEVTADLNASESPDIVNFIIEDITTPYIILVDRTLYKLVETSTSDGNWEDGVYFEGSFPVITYTPFKGEFEPLSTGESRFVLPEGINSEDAVIVFSDVELELAINNNGVVSGGDSIFLQDPVIFPNAIEYVVFNKEDWLTNTGFELLDVDSYDYICIRRELQ